MDLNLDIFKIKHNNIAPQKGRVLVSEPFAKDIYFKRSVVLLTEHNTEGTIGFILNKPVEHPLQEIIKEFPDFEAPVSLGGPVKTDSVHFIHTLGDSIPGAVKVLNDLYWGGDFNELKFKISSGLVSKEQVKFFIGYSGWSPGQLDNEISKNFWLVTDIDKDVIMSDINNVWKNTLTNMGEKYRVWSNFPENPVLN